MSENKTVFDKVDDVELKVDDNSEKLDDIGVKVDGNLEILDDINEKLDVLLSEQQKTKHTKKTENPQITLKRFIARAQKEYMWLGSRDEFKKEKQTALIFVWILIGVGLLATIFTSIAFKIYTTFTLFENIWLIMMLCTVKYIRKSQYYYQCFEFSENSFYRFELDGDGVLRCGPLKKKYKWFSVITCICAFCNIIIVWIEANKMLALIATIFELALGVLSIYVFYYKALDFFCGYCNLRFTGQNDLNTQIISIVYDPTLDKLYTEEDYFKQFPFLK